jgi:hypothetical protein
MSLLNPAQEARIVPRQSRQQLAKVDVSTGLSIVGNVVDIVASVEGCPQASPFRYTRL